MIIDDHSKLVYDIYHEVGRHIILNASVIKGFIQANLFTDLEVWVLQDSLMHLFIYIQDMEQPITYEN